MSIVSCVEYLRLLCREWTGRIFCPDPESMTSLTRGMSGVDKRSGVDTDKTMVRAVHNYNIGAALSRGHISLHTVSSANQI